MQAFVGGNVSFQWTAASSMDRTEPVQIFKVTTFSQGVFKSTFLIFGNVAFFLSIIFHGIWTRSTTTFSNERTDITSSPNGNSRTRWRKKKRAHWFQQYVFQFPSGGAHDPYIIYSIRFVMMPPSLKSYVDLMLDPAAWRTFCVGHLVSWGPGPRGALRDTSSWWVTLSCSPWRQGDNAYSWPSVVALPWCVWFPAPVCPCSLPGINFWFSNYAWPSQGLHPTLAQ